MDENHRMDARVVRTRAAVLKAAEALLFAGGPSAVTYSSLAEQSGIGRATIYRHWPTLDDLWQDISREAARRMQVELAGDLRTNLIAALQLIADRMLSETDRMNFLTMLQRVQYDPETQRFVEMFRAQTPVHQALRQAIASGELPDSHDLSIAAAFLLGPLMQRGLMARDEIEPEFIELVVDRYLSGNGAAR